jgi:hypothetical protein
MSAVPADRWAVPTRLSAAWLAVRVAGHVLLRTLRDSWPSNRVPRHEAAAALSDAPALAEVRSPLWTDGRADEFALVAGKVHNLRVAIQAFDGVVVPAGQVLSFWRQLGRPSRGRGFVLGREVRAGCVVPTVAGGLCQLSNALASAAARAGIQLAERHGHSARIEQAGRSDEVDATVLWNYIDLRLQASFDFRIDVSLTASELVLRLRAAVPAGSPRQNTRVWHAGTPATAVARGCLTCDETRCFRHAAHRALPMAGRRALLLNGWTPEWAEYLAGQGGDADWLFPWVRPARRTAGAWQPPATARQHVALVASLRRTWALRRAAGEGGPRQAAIVRAGAWLADWVAAALKPEHTELLVDQSLLVPLWRQGSLGGRQYDVLVSALPASELQHRLDTAGRQWPRAGSLVDFRVDAVFADAEWAALCGARSVLTPHHDVADCLARQGVRRVHRLPWATQQPMPALPARHVSAVPLVVFPASALPRKGALELAAALRTLGWRLRVLGSPSVDATVWQGVAAEHGRYADRLWLADADVVALPAHVEHAPRALLMALAAGLPVVATPACGLPADCGAITVPAGDVQGLISALQQAVAARTRPAAIADACGQR